MSQIGSIPRKQVDALTKLPHAVRLWSAAFRVAAISHRPAVIEELEAAEVEQFPPRIQRWLKGQKTQPTVVLQELTRLGVGELNRLIDRAENFLDQKVRQIHSGIYFFVDKVDQAIQSLPRDAWISLQAGLIESAWETMNANSHVRVYASIRQEAFSSYESPTKANLFAATTCLDYSDADLQALLNRLAQCYEGLPSFTDFLGTSVVRHSRRPAPEDSFRYVRRHTCGRPRDLVAIASEISTRRSTMSEEGLREVVRRTSSAVVVANVFDEVRVFLNCLGDREDRMRFFSMLPSNILDREEAVRLAEEFNGLSPGALQHFGEESDRVFHPFRDLYVTGLLGVVQQDAETGRPVQRFRRPHEGLGIDAAALPESAVYLIHPTLEDFVRSQRTHGRFLQFQHVLVGEDAPWALHYVPMMQVERELASIEDESFVAAAHEVVKQIQAGMLSSNKMLARLELESGPVWREVHSRINSESEDAVMWIDELAEQLG
ncbi:MAG: hypothetical protein AAGJ46_11195 [Planctomycetota bacterium]